MRCIGVCCLLFMLCTWSAQAQEAVTLTHPIAYVGRDYNLYVTDGTTTLALTTNANFDEFGQGTSYAQPRWSPDGTRLVFIRTITSEGQTIMLAESGSPPQELLGAADGMYFENRVIAWSPDSQQIAFVGNNQEQFGLFALSIEDKRVRYIIPPLAPSIGEAGSDDPAMVLTAQERGASPYRERYDLSWSDTGILFSPVNTCICVQLLTPQGDVLEAWPLGSEFLASISGPYVVARDAYMLSEPPILVDVAHPAEVSLDLPDNARPMAWMDGTLYYATRTDVEVEIGYPDLQTGVAFEDRWMWGFIAESATLTLWRYDPRGTDNLVFQTVGYNFGVVRPTANNRLLVSVVTSNLDGIAAVNRGAAPEEVQDLLARPVTYVLDGDEVVFTLDGGQPDSSSGSFTVVVPN